jgi:16S rRNA processing protein RimM
VGLLAVARVVRPQGRAGEVRLAPLTDEPGRLRDLAECFLVPPPDGERRAVERVRFQGAVPVVKLAGSDGIGDAERLVGRLLAIPRAAARPLPAAHFYPADLVGCAVVAPDGAALGEIAEVEGGPGHDWWVVRAGAREWRLPAVAALVEAVDLAGRRVTARVPEGLVELEG